MKGPKALLDAENNLVTDMGAWFPGERVVFRGKDLHHDLGDMSWMELYLYGITGRVFTSQQIAVFNAMWVLTSYPDPRLWNNRVVALAASAASTGILALSAGVAVSEAKLYGASAELKAHEFLVRTRTKVSEGNNLEKWVFSELKVQRILPGFGRPITSRDERLEPLFRAIQSIPEHQGQHLRLAFEIEDILAKRRYRYRLNYAGATAAVAADLGLSDREYYLFGAFAFVGGMIPAYLLATKCATGQLFPLRCADIEKKSYVARAWQSC